MTESKYGKYVVSTPSVYKLAHGVESTKITGRTPSHIYLDKDILPESDKHVAMMRFTEVPHPNPFIEAHVHPYDEILLFIGSNPSDLTDLGAEIDLTLGDEEETHTITTTTALYLPKGLRHVLKHRSVKRPHTLVAISMSGEYR